MTTAVALAVLVEGSQLVDVYFQPAEHSTSSGIPTYEGFH